MRIVTSRSSTRLLLLTALAAAAPAAARREPRLAEYRGHYSWGFEVSRFVPCGRSDGHWWVTLSDRALAQRDSAVATLRGDAPRKVYVRWTGSVSERMMAGHMGMSTRYFRAGEIRELRLPQTGDCDAPVSTTESAAR